MDIQQIQHAPKVAPVEQTAQNKDDLARAFLATFQTADQAISVLQSEKKQKEEDKKRQRIFAREDYEGYNELEDVLEEIDARLEKMLDIARQLDA
ncbi:MAG: hypothetical protein LBD99_05245 [Candidatus Margulisbacteria bacterium]|jgi:hypothetical protein|nr:hypothetical protein [Candidatus Margulisiibacteriota bacterium]